METPTWHVYILSSLSTKRSYVGITLDLDRRLAEHNSGNTASTRPWVPWEIIYTETFASRSEALKRESYLKRPIGRNERKALLANRE